MHLGSITMEGGQIQFDHAPPQSTRIERWPARSMRGRGVGFVHSDQQCISGQYTDGAEWRSCGHRLQFESDRSLPCDQRCRRRWYG